MPYLAGLDTSTHIQTAVLPILSTWRCASRGKTPPFVKRAQAAAIFMTTSQTQRGVPPSSPVSHLAQVRASYSSACPPIRFHVDNKLGRPTNPGALYKGPPLVYANWSTLWRTRTDMNLARPKPVLCMPRCSSSPADLEHLTKTERQRLVSCTQVEHISVEETGMAASD